MSESDTEETIIDSNTGLRIVPKLDKNIADFSLKLLQDFYLKKDETPQQGFARASLAWSNNDNALAQRLYDGVSKNWFMFSSPVLSNAPLPEEIVRGMPISCFLTFIPDSLKGLIDHSVESRWLSVLGGGVGGHWSDVRSVSDKAPGPIPFIHTIDADMEAYKQGKVRRGSYAAYMSISHPDIIEFLNIRVPSGDISRKCHSSGFHNAVNITDNFMNAVENDLTWDLIDPSTKTIRDTISARKLWEQILEVRYRTGEPFICFIDTANRVLPETQKQLGLRINGSNLCSEIMEPTNSERTAVCCLSSLNAETYDEWKDSSIVEDLIEMLDNVLEYFVQNSPPVLKKAIYSATQERALGLGLMGFHSYLQKHMIPFESEMAVNINKEMFKGIKIKTENSSKRLAVLRGEAPDMFGTGFRNSQLTAIAPNANSAILIGTSPSIEPTAANAYLHQTRAGNWPVKNRYLKRLLESKGMNTDEIWQNIIVNKGSVQDLDFLTNEEKLVFKTAIEIDQKWVIKHASDRQPFISQGQSINLFFPPKCSKTYFHKIHFSAWKQGLKSLYYTRTMTSHRPDNLGQKIERVVLKDGVEDSNIEGDDGCTNCQG